MQLSRWKVLFLIFGMMSLLWGISVPTHALELDWSGQFWSEFNFTFNYNMRGGISPCNAAQDGGYCISSSGDKDAYFQTLFLRLRPRVIVNDNVAIHSEWWVGDPVYGIFGNAAPYSTDQRMYDSSGSRGASITAQRFWGEFVTNLGTIQLGRIPLHWGLGTVWNSGESLWSRYMSTGDAIRWVAKFGSFTFIPSVIVHSIGNSIGGGTTVTFDHTKPYGYVSNPGGKGILFDYSIILKYENTDEQLEIGLNLLRRFAGSGQDQLSGFGLPQQIAGISNSGVINYTVYDIFAKKQFSEFTVAAEVPIVNGFLGSMRYQTFSIASEVNWKANDIWSVFLKSGYVPGQKNSSTNTMGVFNAFYYHPNYHIGMILFNHQLYNYSGMQTQNNPMVSAQSLSSPYYNPIVNSSYVALAAEYKPWDKWTLKPALVYASALQSAQVGEYFYNYWTHTVQQAVQNQQKGLGLEMDLGITFQWDDTFQASWDHALFFPGSFYAFSNNASSGNLKLSSVYSTALRFGVNF